MTDQRKSSKKWIIYTVTFVIAAAALYLQLSYLFRPTNINRINILGYYAEPEDSLDVVFVGGSSTFVFWMPYEGYQNHGFTSYNFSSNSMSPALLKGMLEEARKTQNPELFVVDLRAFEVKERHPDFYSQSYLRGITDSIPYSANRSKTIHYAYSEEAAYALKDPSIYLDFIMYHSRWKDLNKKAFQYMGKSVENLNKGFEFITIYLHEAFEQRDYSGETEKLPLALCDHVLRDLLDYCKDEELNVLFLLNPFFMDDADFTKRYNYIAEVIADYGFPFLDTNDYYEEMELDFSRNFYNRDHVNILGAQKFTRYVGAYLHKHYDLPDRREDPAYADWAAGYPAWQRQLQEQIRITEEAIAQNLAAGQ